ncbi:GerAB/ArcD/ProY family transporter [Peribacillus sp. SCS-155]|uniref:GerAB/ArcD/ProY family transporter n=1 Tax=Peribacillus sedimenti TaxID=3115297 RepID=UPI0039068AEB
MQESSEGKLGVREYTAIMMLTIGVKLADDTPTIIYNKVHNSGWMTALITGIIASIPIFLTLNVLSRYKGKNLYMVFKLLFGKVFGFFISLCLLTIMFAQTIVDMRVNVDIISTLYFTRTPAIVIFALLITVCAYMAKKGIQYVGSTAWMILPYVKITLLLALVLTFFEGYLFSIFPFWGPGVIEIGKQSAAFSSLYFDFFLAAILATSIKSFKDFKKGTWIAFAFLITELTVSLLAFICLFDFPAVTEQAYPFHSVIRYIRLGNFLTHMETFFLPFWVIATFVRFAVLLYMNAMLIGDIFHIKEFEYLLPALGIIMLLIGLVPESPSFVTYYLKIAILQIETPVFISLPILMWIFSKAGDSKNEPKKNHYN